MSFSFLQMKYVLGSQCSRQNDQTCRNLPTDLVELELTWPCLFWTIRLSCCMAELVVLRLWVIQLFLLVCLDPPTTPRTERLILRVCWHRVYVYSVYPCYDGLYVSSYRCPYYCNFSGEDYIYFHRAFISKSPTAPKDMHWLLRLEIKEKIRNRFISKGVCSSALRHLYFEICQAKFYKAIWFEKRHQTKSQYSFFYKNRYFIRISKVQNQQNLIPRIIARIKNIMFMC